MTVTAEVSANVRRHSERGECRESQEEEQEEEEGLFRASAVNEEDPGRDRATPA